MSEIAIKYLGPSNFNYSFLDSRNKDSSPVTNLFREAAGQLSRTAAASWKSLKGRFVWHCPLQKEIRRIRQEKGDLKPQDKEQIIEALRSEHFDLMKDDIAVILSRASVDSVKDIINSGIEQCLKDDNTLNFRVFDCLDLQKLLNLVDLDAKAAAEAMSLEKMYHLSRIYQEKTEIPLLRSVTTEVGRFFLNLVTSFARMYTDVGGLIAGAGVKIKGGNHDVSSLSLPLKLLVCLAAVHWLIDTFIGYELFVAQYALGGVVLGVAGNVVLGLIILYPLMAWINNYFSDLPEDIDHWTNENKKAKHPGPEYVTGRNDEIDEVIDCLDPRKQIDAKGHILLKGPLGVGKSGIVRGLARRIVLGDVPEYFKDKTVFSLDLNTRSGHSAGKILDNFMAATEKYKDKVVVCVGNADKAWTRNAVEQLGKLREDYPHVIFSMTDEEFKKPEINGSGQMQNLRRYDVDQTGEEETLIILKERCRKLNPGEEVDDSVLKQIYDISEELEGEFFQPGRALRVLEAVLKDHRRVGDETQLSEKHDLRLGIEAAGTNSFMECGNLESSACFDVYHADRRPRKSLEEVNKLLKEQTAKVVFLRQMRTLRASLEEAKLAETLKLDRSQEEAEAGRKNWLTLKAAHEALDLIVQDYKYQTDSYYPKITKETVRAKYRRAKGKEKV